MLNTLNAIAGLVTEDPKKARRLIATLGDLLREAVRQDEDRYTVDDEVSWLKRYAELLEARHEGVLRFDWRIDDEVRYAMIPRMLLQPLVENAVKHGALKRGDGGLVAIAAKKEVASDGESLLVCSVVDNGPGLGEARKDSKGLAVVRTQLSLRDPRGTLRLESSDGGTRSVVELPLSLSDRAEAAQ
jgi:sensor histidine kinase YesM